MVSYLHYHSKKHQLHTIFISTATALYCEHLFVADAISGYLEVIMNNESFICKQTKKGGTEWQAVEKGSKEWWEGIAFFQRGNNSRWRIKGNDR